MQLMLIPLPAHSLLNAFVICKTPPLYMHVAMSMFAMKEVMEAMLNDLAMALQFQELLAKFLCRREGCFETSGSLCLSPPLPFMLL